MANIEQLFFPQDAERVENELVILFENLDFAWCQPACHSSNLSSEIGGTIASAVEEQGAATQVGTASKELSTRSEEMNAIIGEFLKELNVS